MKKDLHPFDDLIRQRLSELPPATPTEAGWDRLADGLDHPEDQFLKEALTGLAPTAPAGWAALESRLDPAALADANLADKLKRLEPETPAGAWATFAEVMDTRAANEVDEIVQHRLTAIGGGAVTGWAALAARLELIRERRNRLIAWKITELSLMASVLLLLVRFGPESVIAINSFPTPAVQQEDLLAEGEPTISGTGEVFAGGQGDETAPAIDNDLPLTGGAARSVAGNAIDSGPALSTEEFTDVPEAAATGKAASDGRLYSDLSEEVVEENTVSQDELISDRLTGSELVATEDPAAIVWEAELPVRPILITSSPSVKEAKTVKPSSVYLNVFASPFDVNQIVTKYIPVYDLEVLADNRLTQGSSAGLLLDANRGGFGIQFGVIYSETSYIPTALKWYLQEDYPLFEPVKGYSRFNYARMEVPFSIHQVFAESERWRWTARATASFSVIGRSSFFVNDEELVEAINLREERGAAVDQLLPDGGAARNQADGTDLRQLTDPPLGVFQGGSLLENSGLYLGGGIMVERIISPRTSIYVSPTFGRAIYLNSEKIGLGPYQDRIHTGQFRFGARYRLSKDPTTIVK